MQPHARRLRAAFTLVELLMVIMIIGLLAGLLTAGAWKAIQAGNRAKVVSEIDSLSNALEEYKTKFVGYPPNAASDDRNNRIMVHVRRAFARFVPIPGADNGYSDFRDRILGANPYNTAQYGYNYLDTAGNPQPLDINTLDQAECHVFWLAGFPTPVDTGTLLPISSSPLYGFSANPLDPTLKGGSRIPGNFEFDTKRLRDADLDGWPEYYPDLNVSVVFPPPYVYFDSGTYSSTTPGVQFYQYPCLAPTAPLIPMGPGPYIAEWGVAVPYLEKATAPIAYVNPKKFQIISAGLDGRYGEPGNGAATNKLYPQGLGFFLGDLDNLANFSTGALEDSQP